jgi:hypothetical protein
MQIISAHYVHGISTAKRLGSNSSDMQVKGKCLPAHRDTCKKSNNYDFPQLNQMVHRNRPCQYNLQLCNLPLGLYHVHDKLQMPVQHTTHLNFHVL